MSFHIKIGDVLVYCFVFLLVGGSFFGLWSMGAGVDRVQVRIELDGELVGTYDFPDHDEAIEVNVDAGAGRYNLVTITQAGVYIREANCPDQLCVKWGRIARPGQTLICLPHRVVVSITGEEDDTLDGISS